MQSKPHAHFCQQQKKNFYVKTGVHLVVFVAVYQQTVHSDVEALLGHFWIKKHKQHVYNYAYMLLHLLLWSAMNSHGSSLLVFIDEWYTSMWNMLYTVIAVASMCVCVGIIP